MNDVERQSGIKNATILMVLGGAFHLYFGYASYQLSIVISNPFQVIVGTVLIVFGLLTFCASLIVWLQKSWATKIITGIGVAACATLFFSGFYLMIIIVATIYGLAIKQFRIRRVVNHSDWHVN